MDAQTKPSVGECALGMERRSNDVAVKDVQICHRKEEYASGMEQRLSTNVAAEKDVQIMLKKEEYVLDMGQLSNDAAMKDAQSML